MTRDLAATVAVSSIIIAPLLGALVCWVLAHRRPRAAAGISILAAAASLAGAVLGAWPVDGAGAGDRLVTGLPGAALGSLQMPLDLMLRDWTVVVSAVVALLGVTVQAFLRWYLWTDPRYPAAAAASGLLLGSTQLVILSADVVLTVVGWELAALATALLVVHDPVRTGAPTQAARGWLAARFLDIPFVVGLLALAGGAGSTAADDIAAFWSRPGQADTITFVLASVGVVVGVLARGAQVPFTGWLRDTIGAPLPGAALIQGAGSTVAAVVVLTSWAGLLFRAGPAQAVLVVVTVVSVAVSGLCALASTDLRSVLTWVTVGHVGALMLSVAVVPQPEVPAVVVTLLAAHAVVIGLASLLAAWSTVVVGSTVTARLSGVIRRHPRLSRGYAITAWSLAAAPPTIAFVGAQLVSSTAAHEAASGRVAATAGYLALALGAVLGAAVAMRVWLIVQHRTVFERRSHDTVIQDSYDVTDVGIVELLTNAPQVDESGHTVSRRPDVVDTEPRPSGLSRLAVVVLSFAAVLGGAVVLVPGMAPAQFEPNWMLSAAVLLLMAAAGLSVRIASLRTVFGDAAERLPRWWRSLADRHLGTAAIEERLAVLVTAPAAVVRAGQERLDRLPDALVRHDSAPIARLVRLWDRTGPAVALGCVVVAGLCAVILW